MKGLRRPLETFNSTSKGQTGPSTLITKGSCFQMHATRERGREKEVKKGRMGDCGHEREQESKMDCEGARKREFASPEHYSNELAAGQLILF